MTAIDLIKQYITGNLPIAYSVLITILLTILAYILAAIYKQKKRANKEKIKNLLKNPDIYSAYGVREVSGPVVDPALPFTKVLIDTPHQKQSFPMPNGDPIVNSYKRLHDWFVRWWFYDTITVIRLKNEGKADHRAYCLKDIQMSTFNWDNCTYHVREKALFPIRKQWFMVVLENVSEPVDFRIWKTVTDLLTIHTNKVNYDLWTDDEKKHFGKFDCNPKGTYTKMNDRNAQLLGMTSIPNLQVLFYASCIGCFGVLILLMMAFGIMNSAQSSQIENLKLGILEVLKVLKAHTGG